MSYRSSAASNGATGHRNALSSGAALLRVRECPVCLGEHQEEIHDATVRVRRWFRDEVTKGFQRRPVC